MAEMTPAERGHRALREGGYANGGHVDAEQDKAMVISALRQHENAEHGGKHEKISLRKGGAIKGAPAGSNPGKRGRSGFDHHAAGGHVKDHGKPGIGKVNIVIAHPPSGGPAGIAGAPPPVMAPHPPMPAPMPGGPAPGMAGPPMPPRPPMMPPGAGPGMPPPGMMRAAGGRMRDGRGRFAGGAV